MKGKLLFLGTGASAGVPLIGCECNVCCSRSHFNKRMRPSALVKIDQKQFLIDAGPDFRTQALTFHIDKLDGVLITHAHHDHTAGVDDLRVFQFKSKKSLPMLLSQESADDIKRRFYYIFEHNKYYDHTVPKFKMQILPKIDGEVIFEDIPISFVSFEQGGMKVNGFRFGDMAYLSDIRVFDTKIFNSLSGVNTLIISALRHEESPLHFSLQEAIEFVEHCGAKKAWLTHMAHDLEHEETNKNLPAHIKLAYDGLEIDFG